MAAMDEGIVVTGVGQATGTPDVAHLHVRVEVEKADVGRALAALGQDIAAIGSAVRAAGLADRDIRTTSTQVYPVHTQDGQRVRAHRAGHGLRLTVREIDHVSRIVDACVGVAGDRLVLENIELAIDDPGALRTRAREAAFEEARSTATELARYAGRPLGQVLSVVEGSAAAAPRPMMRMAAMSMNDSAGGVEAGESSVSARVTVHFALD